ncbi:MAG: hypothetical protein CBC38_07635 [Gammaproteobacteria bacterium TMED78]|nr:MAG: hypothetical protein CBC38_07635 [Gammaproteobacteria bacterium TMED78]|tara:strand:+ start:254 stop:850 length:597 start_codon:yes stop_codon:yes gene_type:complete
MLLKYNFIFLSLFFLSILDSNILAQEESPSLVVSETARLTLDAIQGKEEYFKTNSEELYTLINKILLPNFDRNYAAYLVLGRYGRDATQEQKSRFSIAIYSYIVKRYAFGILKFQSNQLSFFPHQISPEDERTTVRGTVKLNDGQAVSVDYDLRLNDSKWRVYDISIDGISYVRNLRSQLGSEIRRDGLDAVISRLEN